MDQPPDLSTTQLERSGLVLLGSGFRRPDVTVTLRLVSLSDIFIPQFVYEFALYTEYHGVLFFSIKKQLRIIETVLLYYLVTSLLSLSHLPDLLHEEPI
jgi:hypothetical protein